MDTELIELEQQGWQALSAGGQTALDFYGRVLDEEVVMLLPGGMRLDDRAVVLEAMGGPPWASHRLEEPRVLQLGADSAVVTYGVVAQRAGAAPYSALMSSGYVRRDDGWKLAFHQQTPR